ncbi:MAG: hypothetical protein M1574_06355 [Gammaproteobacteria bacterium]|nr:hypothetical protein [Gammaproteobacteria bacterium]
MSVAADSCMQPPGEAESIRAAVASDHGLSRVGHRKILEEIRARVSGLKIQGQGMREIAGRLHLLLGMVRTSRLRLSPRPCAGMLAGLFWTPALRRGLRP